MRSVVIALIAVLICFASAARAEDKQLNLFAWSEYVPQNVIDGFTKETGIKVSYETYPSNEEMLNKLVAGATQYDLVQPSEYTVEALIKNDLLAPLDHTQIPNIKNLLPKFQTEAYDPGLKYSIPYMAGTVGIVVNTAKVKDPILGFQDVFQPKFNQRIVVVNDPRELVSWALAVRGISTNDISKKSLAEVKPLLGDWMKLIRVYDSDSPKTSLLNGDCDLGVVWSGEAALLFQQDKKFKYVLPVEGAHQFIDNLCVPKTAPHPANAMAFMNYILRPDVSVLISRAFPYTNPNAEARKLLTPEEMANPASYPPGDPKLDIFHDIGKASGDVQRLVDGLKNRG